MAIDDLARHGVVGGGIDVFEIGGESIERISVRAALAAPRDSLELYRPAKARRRLQAERCIRRLACFALSRRRARRQHQRAQRDDGDNEEHAGGQQDRKLFHKAFLTAISSCAILLPAPGSAT